LLSLQLLPPSSGPRRSFVDSSLLGRPFLLVRAIVVSFGVGVRLSPASTTAATLQPVGNVKPRPQLDCLKRHAFAVRLPSIRLKPLSTTHWSIEIPSIALSSRQSYDPSFLVELQIPSDKSFAFNFTKVRLERLSSLPSSCRCQCQSLASPNLKRTQSSSQLNVASLATSIPFKI
jgi:hypothetical protein